MRVFKSWDIMVSRTHWALRLLLTFFIIQGILIASYVFGMKVFVPWQQVLELYSSDGLAISPNHAHFYRFIIAYPGLHLNSILPHLGFSLYIGIFLFLNVVLWYSLLHRKIKRKSIILISCFLLLLAHLLMNGRGVIAWSSWILFLDVAFSSSKVNIVKFIKVVVSCALATVSTGVFLLVAVSALVWFARVLMIKEGITLFSKLILFGLCLLVTPFVSSFFVLAIEKNINYFGGDVDGLILTLTHGAGEWFFVNPFTAFILTVSLLNVFFVSCYLGLRVGFSSERFLFYPLFIISGVSGLFGYLTATLIIPLGLYYSFDLSAKKFNL